MSIDVKKALAASIPTQQSSWDEDDVILYHLGIGAGVGKATDAKELEYTYEKSLKVLPSFAVIPVTSSLASLTHVLGIDINSALLLHGEQEVEIHRPLPVAAEIESSARIAGIYDKGKAALIVLEVKTRLKAGEPLFTNRFSLFARGEGGFGGDSGPRRGSEIPARKPDAVVETSTVPHQPLLYRLSGDKNPLHVKPSFAKRGGFDITNPARPLLLRNRLQGRR